MCLFVCLGFVCVSGGRMGGVIVSLGRCVCLCCGGVFAGLVTLCWGGLGKEGCACVQMEDIAIYSDFRGRLTFFSRLRTDVERERETGGEDTERIRKDRMRGKWLDFAVQ